MGAALSPSIRTDRHPRPGSSGMPISIPGRSASSPRRWTRPIPTACASTGSHLARRRRRCRGARACRAFRRLASYPARYRGRPSDGQEAVLLHFRLRGLESAESRLLPLGRLFDLCRHRRFARTLFPRDSRIARGTRCCGCTMRSVRARAIGRSARHCSALSGCAATGAMARTRFAGGYRRLVREARDMARGGYRQLMRRKA